MRPLFGDGPPQRPRASDNHAGQTTYFLADEAALDAALEQSFTSFSTSLNAGSESRKQQQQQQAAPAAGSVESGPASPCVKSTPPHDRDSSVSSTSAAGSFDDHADADADVDADGDDVSLASDAPSQRKDQPYVNNDPSRPITPMMLATSGPASAISGVSSRRNSVTASVYDEVASQVLSLTEDAEQEPLPSMMDSGSAPQLVMPSIKMPSRRPFTDEGKRIGRLKVLIAGDSGIGKTALIKAIVQSSDAIVHVDPISPPTMFSSQRSIFNKSRGRSKTPKNSSTASEISEIYASTKPYPEWWSDLDDSRILKRRKSLGGDTILDRNICFVDTPGYSDGSSVSDENHFAMGLILNKSLTSEQSMETITPVIRYVESHFEKVQSNASTDSDLLSMLGGDGGGQVDVVLYLIQNKLKPADIKYLQLLTPLTNIVPLLAQADNMTPDAVTQSKARIRSELIDAGIRAFSFDMLGTSAKSATEPACPYAVSSTLGSDHDVMDASLLMSPDYVQPLVPSELTTLVEQVFCENGASWLRHAAAKKYIQWKNSENPSRPKALYRPMSFPAAQSMSLVTTAPLTVPMGATSVYSLARIADHTQREERLAQIRLANWASDLQRSLANERARYEKLARGERAIWLTEKLNECVQDGTLVAVGDRGRSNSRLREQIRRKLGCERGQGSSRVQHQDPLGLLEVAAKLRARGWVAIEILGGVGVLGGVAFWVSKQGWHAQVVEWAVQHWSSIWDGER